MGTLVPLPVPVSSAQITFPEESVVSFPDDAKVEQLRPEIARLENEAVFAETDPPENVEPVMVASEIATL